MHERHQLRQFLVIVFALLIPCFVLWTFFAGALAIPAVGLVDMALGQWFPDAVHGLLFQDGRVLLMTEFGEQGGRPVPLDQSEYRLGFQINPGILSYSLPFYAALHFATRRDNYLGDFVTGVVVLYAIIAVSLLCLCLRELMVNLGALFLEQPGAPNSNAIGICYQLSVLILPTLAPISLWLWQNHDSDLLRGPLRKLQRLPSGSGDSKE